ncbi:hydrogenase nickel incorporation protein HypA/HybF [Rhodobium gokarnense]|uniref:Hydrogenase maturation factor HypA n=2 Tax=Rhodobium gokarnense TaxID=364296 RepID=A0ABT3H8X6_9HYPH|nr:hydrogenase nickel incorporation protein HypA/HybF [Rhodobium gokarnense]
MSRDMHEMSLTESLIEIVAETARREGFDRVAVVRLEIGALSHVSPEAMEFCFSAVAGGTVADGAELDILRIPAKAWCLDCAREVPIAERYDPCPHCGGHQLQPTSGEELKLKELEVA